NFSVVGLPTSRPLGAADHALDLVAELLRHRLDALVLPRGVAVLDLDLLDLGLAVRGLAGDGDRQVRLLILGRPAAVRRAVDRHPVAPAAIGGIARQAGQTLEVWQDQAAEVAAPGRREPAEVGRPRIRLAFGKRQALDRFLLALADDDGI